MGRTRELSDVGETARSRRGGAERATKGRSHNGAAEKAAGRRVAGKLPCVRTWAWRIFVSASLLLFCATVGLWVRAQWASDLLDCEQIGEGERGPVARWVRVCPGRGSIGVSGARLTIAPESAAEARAMSADPRAKPGLILRHDPPWSFPEAPERSGRTAAPAVRRGFAFEWWSYGNDAPTRADVPVGDRVLGVTATSGVWLAVPWWFLTLLFALAPARAFWRWRKNKRRPPHACPRCGYDRRATPDSSGPRLATCPECGHTSAGGMTTGGTRERARA
jgi:hypothetical protein